VGKSMGLDCENDRREPLASAMNMASVPKRMQQCKTQLKTKHGLVEEHFTHFTTEQASRDVDAIRALLGAEQLNLVGASYGTRAALDYMRQYPDRVRRSIIDGVAPPDMVLPLAIEADSQAALDAVFKACEADAACNSRYPKLADALNKALEALPQPIEMRHPISLQRERVVLSKEAVLNTLRSPLYSPPLAQALPKAITLAAQGDYTPLVGLATSFASTPGTELAWGMHFSVVCAEDFPRMQGAATPPTVWAGQMSKLYVDVCAQWPQAPVSPAFFNIAAAKMPTLVMSGGADPVTPARHGERVAKALGPKARHVVAPQVGHGVMAVGCGRDVVMQFINARNDQAAMGVKTKCLERIPRPIAFKTADTKASTEAAQ
jgi:pimeloyl-ACP methyl ester carboxylesterase